MAVLFYLWLGKIPAIIVNKFKIHKFEFLSYLLPHFPPRNKTFTQNFNSFNRLNISNFIKFSYEIANGKRNNQQQFSFSFNNGLVCERQCCQVWYDNLRRKTIRLMPFVYFFKHGFGHANLYRIALSIRSF